MVYYAIGDIHGCYDKFCELLNKINLTDDDVLILIGDYIDRGPDSYKMLLWIEENFHKKNIIFIRGNHEQEFIFYSQILSAVKYEDSLLDSCKRIKDRLSDFDKYNTILKLITEHGATLEDINRWAKLFGKMPLHYHKLIKGKTFWFAHAGFVFHKYADEDITLYDRGETYSQEPVKCKAIVHGHTPTIIKNDIYDGSGYIHKYEDKNNDFEIYNIDCGCCYSDKSSNAALGCLCIDSCYGIVETYV